jgi:hypothetical protein
MKNRRLRFTGNWKSYSSVSIIVLILWSMIAASVMGCSPEKRTQFTGTPTVLQALTSSATGEVGVDQIMKSLTRRKWQQIRTQDPNLASEIVTWEFYANGMFRWQFTSDFSETRVGAWAIAPTSEESGVMFLASTMNDPSRFDVLSLRLQNSGLRLGEFSYQETPFIDSDTPPNIQQDDREAVTNQKNHFFSLWITITATDWRSKSNPLPGDSNMYSLRQDGTYTSHVDVTQCQLSGTWSMSISGMDSSAVWLSVPNNACDPRGAQQAFVREIPVRLDGDELILYETVYVPLPRGR